MCDSVKMPGGGTAIICGVRTHPRYCATCGREAVALCDWKVPSKYSGTCDQPMCAQHAKRVALNKHLCPEHQRRYDEWNRRRKNPTQGNLFEERVA